MENNTQGGSFSRLMQVGKSKGEQPPVASTGSKKVEKASMQASKVASSQAFNIACDVVIGANDIESLRQTAHTNRSYRFTEPELEGLEDTEYRLNKKLRGKSDGRKDTINKNEIVRISLKLFEKIVQNDEDTVLTLIQSMK